MKCRTIASLLLGGALLLSLCACSENPGVGEPLSPTASPAPIVTPEPTPEPMDALPGVHTLNLSFPSAPSCWNVHNWVSQSDYLLASLTASPLVSLGLETAEGRMRDAWVYELAADVEDITGTWALSADWGIGEDEAGRVWRIRLRDGVCWADGTPITAETYLYSMRECLSPLLDNHRAETYCSGAAALLGASAYRHSGEATWEENNRLGELRYPASEWSVDGNGAYRAGDGTPLYFSLKEPLSVWLDGSSLEDYALAGYLPAETFDALLALADENGYVPVTTQSADLLYSFTGSEDWGRESFDDLAHYTVFRKTWPASDWSSVGLLAEDEHTLIYICEQPIGRFDFLYALTTPWLVYEPLYENGKFQYNGETYTDYGSSPETSMSCGPYYLSKAENGQYILERNGRWYGYADGGELYEADRIVLETLRAAEARDRFEAGRLDLYIPDGAEDLPLQGSTLSVEDGYTYRFIMVTDHAALEELSTPGTNRTCLANSAFRDALSYAIDRAQLTRALGDGSIPALGLIGGIYRYDVSTDPATRYRDSLGAMVAICTAYGVSIGDPSDAALRAAWESCTGYDPQRARHLFELAYAQMVTADDWDDGMTIELRCAVSDDALTEGQLRMNEAMQEMLDAAVEGTGFAGKLKITFCTVEDRLAAVAAGEIEMAWGAWGGAAFDPYGLMQCYCDPDFNTIQEGCGFDPKTKLLSLLIEDEAVTKTYGEWCDALLRGGEFFGDSELRLKLLSDLEAALLKERRFIVVAQGAQPICLSGQIEAGSETYSILTGFGGIRSLHFTCDDAEWAAQN